MSTLDPHAALASFSYEEFGASEERYMGRPERRPWAVRRPLSAAGVRGGSMSSWYSFKKDRSGVETTTFDLPGGPYKTGAAGSRLFRQLIAKGLPDPLLREMTLAAIKWMESLPTEIGKRAKPAHLRKGELQGSRRVVSQSTRLFVGRREAHGAHLPTAVVIRRRSFCVPVHAGDPSVGSCGRLAIGARNSRSALAL